MPIRVQTKAMMEEDFPRGIPFVSSIEDLNANSTEVEIKRPSSIKTKRKNKIRQLLDGQTGVNKEDLLAEDKDELKKIREEEATENGDELFKVPKKKPSKKKKKIQSEESLDDKDDEDEYFLVEPLTYDSISVGFLSLGLVHEIKDHEVIVTLPGRTVGSIPIRSVSKHYLKLLTSIEQSNDTSGILQSFKPLTELFTIGQLIIVKVIDIHELDNGKRKIILTTDPYEINSNYNSTLINEDMIFIAAVQSKEDHGLVMDLGIKGSRAFLPKNKIKSKIFSSIGIGELLKCKVDKCQIQKLVCTVTLSANTGPQIVEEELNSSLLLPGMQVEANIMQTHKTGLKVYFMELMGTIYQDHTSKSWELPITMEKYSTITATILYIHPTTGSLPALTLRNNLIPFNTLKSGFYSKGKSYQVKIERFEKRGVIIKLDNGQKGIVSTRRCFRNKDPTKESSVTQAFPTGSKHLCRILEYSGIDDIYVGSFALANASEQRNITDVQLGSIVTCTILSWKKAGALVMFDGLRAFITSIHFDKFSPRITPARFPEHSKLKAKVFRVNIEEGKMSLTVRKKLLRSKLPAFSSVNEIQVGQVIDGIIHKSGPKGIVVTIIGGLMGFIPASLLDVPSKFISERHKVGDLLTVKAIEVKPERPTLIFALEEEEDVKPDLSDLEEEIKLESEPSSKKSKATKKSKSKKNFDAVVKEEEVEVKSEPVLRPLKRKIVTELKVEGSFWGDDDLSAQTSKNQDDSDDELSSGKSYKPNAKKSKSVREEAVKQKEADIRERENALADPTRNPESADDYELLVMASPNSSMCWIKYISFHLEAGDTDLARKIGERALSVIPSNEEQERFNVWTALLNLENEYGTEESLRKTFENAARNCDALETYKTMGQIYVKSKKNTEAEKLYKIMIKKFPDSDSVWTMAAVFFYRIKNLEQARILYTKAISRLDKRFHVELISKFAQLELTFGDFEQGRSLYEKLVTTYPSRCDLWLVYVNQLIKQKDYDGVRNLFDRVTHSTINPKKITPILKRFLEFEKEHGTPESIAYVENSCTDYFTAKFGRSVQEQMVV